MLHTGKTPLRHGDASVAEVVRLGVHPLLHPALPSHSEAVRMGQWIISPDGSCDGLTEH